MVQLSGRAPRDVVSAGFLGARYGSEQPWVAHGKSVGLGIPANAELVIPSELFVGKYRGTYGLLFATDKRLLQGLEHIQLAVWGMTEPSLWGDMLPVYAPLHPDCRLTAEAVLCD